MLPASSFVIDHRDFAS